MLAPRMPDASLRSLFLSAAPPALVARLEADPELEVALRGLCERAESAWPELPFQEAAFLGHVARTLSAAALDAGLESLHAEHLWLAAACATGVRRAQTLFDDRMLRPLLRAHVKDDADELAQRLREKLFAGAKPKIADYAGRGSMLGWLGIVARREAIDLSRRRQEEPRHRSADEEVSLADVVAADPEVRALKGQGRDVVANALRAALTALPEAERKLLQLHYLEGKPHGEIGQAVGMPRSTVAHRLQGARVKLLQSVRAQLSRELRLREEEADSLIGAVRSHLDLSLSFLKRD